jgi:NNP family nitrate/nitrite transporter-like MFS transporter
VLAVYVPLIVVAALCAASFMDNLPVGALGGPAINLAFRQSFQTAGTGAAAFRPFLVFYGLCSTVTWAVYLRRAAAVPAKPQLGYAEVWS